MIRPILSPERIDAFTRALAPLVEGALDLHVDELVRRGWAAVPVESACHFTVDDAEQLADAIRSLGLTQCVALAADPLAGSPCLEVPATKEALLEFSHTYGRFNYVLAAEGAEFVVLCTVEDYFIVAGPVSFVLKALGASIESARTDFERHADGRTADLLTAASHRYAGVNGPGAGRGASEEPASVLGRMKSIVKILGALGFVLIVLCWFPLHDYVLLQDTELFLAPGERREIDVAAFGRTRVVINGWMYPAWRAASGDRGEIAALDGVGGDAGRLRGGYGPYSLEGPIERLTIRSGDAPTRVTIRVLSEESAADILQSERTLQVLGVVLLIPFLSLLVVLLSRWMARESSTLRPRRRLGWIAVAIVGSQVLFTVFHAVVSRIGNRYAVAPVVPSLGFLSWAAGLWADVVVVLILASLERRAIGGRLLELRASFRAVLAGTLALAACWCSWKLLEPFAPLRAGPWRVDSTGDFPGAVLLALSAGICEEVVFRGFLMTRLRELTGSTVGSLLATSTAFGLVHLYDSGWHAVQAGTFGFILGVVTLRTRNLYPAIWVHAAWDLLLTVALTFDAVRGYA